MDRKQAIRIIVGATNRRELLVSANGMISRDVYAVKDSPSNFYMLGSMGLASSIGLGIALSRPLRKVVVLDGDGNILMNFGSLATIGNLAPKNLIHVILDNESYDSTGGQPTASTTTRIDKVAKACGYRNTLIVSKAETLVDAFRKLLGSSGPSLILIKIDRSHDVSPRVPYEPEAISQRFRDYISTIH